MNRVYLPEVASYARRGAIEITMAFRVSAKSGCSTFTQFFQFFDKLRARQKSVVLPKFLPIDIENDQGGEAVHVILACEVQVLLFQFSSLSLPPRTTRPREV